MGRPGILGVGVQRKALALGSPPHWGSLGRTPGSSGSLPQGAGLSILTNEQLSPRPRPSPEPRPRRVPNSRAPWPGAARARNLRLVSAHPQGLRPDPASSPCPRALGHRSRCRGVTQRWEGGHSLGLEIRTLQGLECRDEWGERVSSELVPGQCWGVGRSWGGGERASPGDQGRATEATAAPPCLGQGHGGGRVLSF